MSVIATMREDTKDGDTIIWDASLGRMKNVRPTSLGVNVTTNPIYITGNGNDIPLSLAQYCEPQDTVFGPWMTMDEYGRGQCFAYRTWTDVNIYSTNTISHGTAPVPLVYIDSASPPDFPKVIPTQNIFSPGGGSTPFQVDIVTQKGGMYDISLKVDWDNLDNQGNYFSIYIEVISGAWSGTVASDVDRLCAIPHQQAMQQTISRTIYLPEGSQVRAYAQQWNNGGGASLDYPVFYQFSLSLSHN